MSRLKPARRKDQLMAVVQGRAGNPDDVDSRVRDRPCPVLYVQKYQVA